MGQNTSLGVANTCCAGSAGVDATCPVSGAADAKVAAVPNNRAISKKGNIVRPTSAVFDQARIFLIIDYLRLPPPREPPPREPPILDAPRELLMRALPPLPAEPPKAPPLELLGDTLRFPMRSPPPPRFAPLSPVPAVGRLPARSPSLFALRLLVPRLLTPDCCCR